MNILEFIRSLGFGGLLGAGVMALIYSTNPTWFSESIVFEQFLIIGGLIGAGSHGLIDKWFIKSFLSPIGDQVKLFSKFSFIWWLKKTRIISHAKAEELLGRLIEVHVMGEIEENTKKLPRP